MLYEKTFSITPHHGSVSKVLYTDTRCIRIQTVYDSRTQRTKKEVYKYMGCETMEGTHVRLRPELKRRLEALKTLLYGESDNEKTYNDVIEYLIEHCLGTKIVFNNKFEELINISKVLEEGGDPERTNLLHLFKTAFDKTAKSKKNIRDLNVALVEYLTGTKFSYEDEGPPPAPQAPLKPVQTKQTQGTDGAAGNGGT